MTLSADLGCESRVMSTVMDSKEFREFEWAVLCRSSVWRQSCEYSKKTQRVCVKVVVFH